MGCVGEVIVILKEAEACTKARRIEGSREILLHSLSSQQTWLAEATEKIKPNQTRASDLWRVNQALFLKPA